MQLNLLVKSTLSFTSKFILGGTINLLNALFIKIGEFAVYASAVTISDV